MRKISTIIDGNIKGFCDEDAFAELYKKYCGRVAFICHKFCDNKEDVEEVVQDTFMIAFKKSAELRADTLMAYLRKVAIRESIRKRNASGRRQQLVITSEELPINSQELDQSFLPEEALQNKERKSELMRLIDSLPKMQREMIYMYYFADFSVAEIAELMECSAHNVRQTLYTARNALKTKLEGKGKKTKAKLAVFVPLGELFLIEEQAFAAAAVATVAKPIKGYLIATSIVTAGIIATVLYFNLRPTYEDYPTYQPLEPVYETYIPYETEADTTEEPTKEIEPIPPPTVEEEPEEELEEHEEQEEQEPEQEQEPELEQPQAQPQVEPPPTTQEEPPAEHPAEETYEPVLEEAPEPEPAETTPPEPEEVVELPLPPPPEIIEPEPEEDPDPVHIDRTAQILAALAAANAAQDVNNIIGYFNFTFERQMFGSMDERFRFYVTNEGSGDILIGMAALEDGTGWRMRFEHYHSSQRPASVSDLLRWMD